MNANPYATQKVKEIRDMLTAIEVYVKLRKPVTGKGATWEDVAELGYIESELAMLLAFINREE